MWATGPSSVSCSSSVRVTVEVAGPVVIGAVMCVSDRGRRRVPGRVAVARGYAPAGCRSRLRLPGRCDAASRNQGVHGDVESTALPSTVTSAGTVRVADPGRPDLGCQPDTSAITSSRKRKAASASGSTSPSRPWRGARHPLAHQHPHRGHHHDGDQERPDQHAALDVRDDHRGPGSRRESLRRRGRGGSRGSPGTDRTGGRRYAPTPWSPIRSPPTPTVWTPGPRLLRFPRRPSVPACCRRDGRRRDGC